MDRFDKLVRERCCHLTEGQKIKSGLKTHRQLKDAIATYKLKGNAKHFAGEAQMMNTNIKNQILDPVSIKNPMGTSMPIPPNVPPRPGANVAPIVPPPVSLQQQVQQGEAEEAVREVLQRQESVQSEIQELVAELEGKAEAGEAPDAGDLSALERLERENERLQRELEEARFEIGRQKELVKVGVQQGIEGMEEAEELQAVLSVKGLSKADLQKYLFSQEAQIKEMAKMLPADQRLPKSRWGGASAATLANYLLTTLGIDAGTILTTLENIKRREEERAGGAGPSQELQEEPYLTEEEDEEGIEEEPVVE